MDLKEVMMGTAPKAPSQNLINPTKQQYGPSQTAKWKAGILDVFSVLAAVAFGFTYYRYLINGLSPWYVFGAALFFCVMSSLQVFLSRDIRWRTFVVVGETIGFIAFFVGRDEWQIMLTAGIITFLVLMWGYTAGKSRLDNSIEVPFFGTTGAVIGKVVTAALLFMIMVYIPQASSGALIPRTSFETFFNWSSDFLNQFYPNLPFKGSFGTFSESVAQMELANNPTFATMSPSAQGAAVTQASNELSSAVAAKTGNTPSPEESVSDVAYNYLANSFLDWQNQVGSASLVLWVIILFLILRTISVVFVWIAEFVTLVFYEVLLASGFMHIDHETQTKELIAF